MIEQCAAEIRFLILDVDGVLTDGTLIMSRQGEIVKCFHSRDGLGLRILMNAGIGVGIISGRKSKALEYRARELGIKDLFQGHLEKAPLLRDIMRRRHLKKEHICCIGDDISDLAIFRGAGLTVAVADAVPEVREAAMFVTKNNGGRGAVREVCELILKAQGKWEEALNHFGGGED